MTSVGATVPPANPVEGRCDIVGAGAVGAWSGHGGAIAGWTAAGWRFVSPREGMAVWNEGDGSVLRYRGGVWQIRAVVATGVRVGGVQVVGARQPAIAEPAGGSAPDAEARAVIGAMLAALRAHGLIAPPT